MHNTYFGPLFWSCKVLWLKCTPSVNVVLRVGLQDMFMSCRFFKVLICPFTSAYSLPLLIRLTGAAHEQGKDGARLFLLALSLTRCDYRHKTAFQRAYCYCNSYSRCGVVKSLSFALRCFSVRALHLILVILSSFPHLCLAVSLP